MLRISSKLDDVKRKRKGGKRESEKGRESSTNNQDLRKRRRTSCLFGGIGNYACHFFFFFFSNLCSRRGVIMLDNEWVIEYKLQHRLHEKTSSLSSIKKKERWLWSALSNPGFFLPQSCMNNLEIQFYLKVCNFMYLLDHKYFCFRSSTVKSSSTKWMWKSRENQWLFSDQTTYMD